MVVVEGGGGRGPIGFPHKEAAEEEVNLSEASGESAPEPEGAQAPPPEDQEDAQGAYPSPGALPG